MPLDPICVALTEPLTIDLYAGGFVAQIIVTSGCSSTDNHFAVVHNILQLATSLSQRCRSYNFNISSELIWVFQNVPTADAIDARMAAFLAWRLHEYSLHESDMEIRFGFCLWWRRP